MAATSQLAMLILIGAINLPSASRRLTEWLSLFNARRGLRIDHISADECQIPHHPFSFYQEVSAQISENTADACHGFAPETKLADWRRHSIA